MYSYGYIVKVINCQGISKETYARITIKGSLKDCHDSRENFMRGGRFS